MKSDEVKNVQSVPSRPNLGDRIRLSPHRGCFTGEVIGFSTPDNTFTFKYFYKDYRAPWSAIVCDRPEGYWLLIDEAMVEEIR